MLASNLHESIKVQLDGNEKTNWAYADYAMGVAIGSYESIAWQVYGETCYTSLFTYAYNGVSANQYFVNGIELDHWWDYVMNVGLGLGIGYVLDTYYLYDTCALQYQAREDAWYADNEVEEQGTDSLFRMPKHNRTTEGFSKAMTERVMMPMLSKVSNSLAMGV